MSVKFDHHRYYTIVYDVNDSTGEEEVAGVIASTDPGEGPYLFDSIEEYEGRIS